MLKHKKKNTKRIFLITFSALLSVFILIALFILSYFIAYDGKIYPNTKVAGINVSGLTTNDAQNIISQKINYPTDIALTYQDQNYSIKISDINLIYDASSSALQAYKFTRKGNIYYDITSRLNLLKHGVDSGLVYTIDETKLTKIISVIAGQISVDPVDPYIVKGKSDITVYKGASGKEVDRDKLVSIIKNNLLYDSVQTIVIPVERIDHTITDQEASVFLNRAEKFIGKSIDLKFEYSTISLDDADIFKIIDPFGGLKESAVTDLENTIANKIERQPQNPKFVFDKGKVTEFEPALDGITLDKEKFTNDFKNKIEELSDKDVNNISLDIEVIKKSPDFSIDKVNSYGIKELIGRGTSTYFHSIPGRVHNIVLAAQRINGTLVAPGETFSFNKTLGDVSAFTGYQQAYIISEGKTILGDGGGVCQVSSTLFRSVLDAGLPVVERQAHAYRVGYYEQGSLPGFDATVYSPSPDFKFTNDTNNYVLIEAIPDTKNYSLVFELYGTKDGRDVSITKPVITNVSAPPPDVYQDDPTLPAGTIKQIDYKAWGAKVTFNYVVKKNGQEIINKTFISNYKPWAAVYLKGVGPSN